MSFILLMICTPDPYFLVIITSFHKGSCISAPWVSLLPLRLAGFMGALAEAAKSCFRGEFAAFALGRFHGVIGRGSKILLSVALLLPLCLAGFIGSPAKAAKSCYPRGVCCLCAWGASWGHRQRQQKLASCGVYAAFALGGFHGLDGRSSKILLSVALLLPLRLGSFMGS